MRLTEFIYYCRHSLALFCVLALFGCPSSKQTEIKNLDSQSAVTVDQGSELSGKSRYYEIWSMHNKGEFQNALEAIDRVLADNPDDAVALEIRAIIVDHIALSEHTYHISGQK